MTKQEEIRERVEAIEFTPDDLEANLGSITWHLTPSGIERIFRRLHSQGVVLRVDRELPVCEISKTLTGNSQAPDCPYFLAGYKAVESLIEEDK